MGVNYTGLQAMLDSLKISKLFNVPFIFLPSPVVLGGQVEVWSQRQQSNQLLNCWKLDLCLFSMVTVFWIKNKVVLFLVEIKLLR